MILLGVNCGFGNRDVATLQKSSVDLNAGVIDFPRPKTQVQRRATLWPETIDALKEASKKRPKPKDKTEEKYWFITTHGECYVRFGENGTWLDAVRQMFNRRLNQLKIKTAGRGFYGLRRSCLTEEYDEELDDVPEPSDAPESNSGTIYQLPEPACQPAGTSTVTLNRNCHSAAGP